MRRPELRSPSRSGRSVTGRSGPRPGSRRRPTLSLCRPPVPGFAANAAAEAARSVKATPAATIVLVRLDMAPRVLHRSRIVYVPIRVARVIRRMLCLAAAVGAVAACGGSDSASHVAELGAYDAEKPLHIQVEAENDGSTDVSFQSPRGGDVEATVVLPPEVEEGKRYPVAVYSHP